MTDGGQPAGTNPLEAIREPAREAVASGDPGQIKALYTEFGDLLDAAYRGSATADVPVLSRPETLGVIVRPLRTFAGLLLDAGCGPNPVAAVALGRAPGRTIIGLDLGFGTVRLAREVAAAAGIRLPVVVGDLEALPFAPGVFGAAVCDDTIEHVPDDRRAVTELARVIKSGGRLVLATPNRWSIQTLLRKAEDRLRGHKKPAFAYFVTPSHLREYRFSELKELVVPEFRIRRRLAVGWMGGGRRALATRLVMLPLLRAVDQVLVIDAEVR